MSEISLYEAQKKKMQGLCDEHELTYRFHKEQYPITFVLRPTQGMDAQMSMLECVEEKGYISPDAAMIWVFNDGVFEIKVEGGTFTIGRVLRNKIENILVKMITYWQQYFFRNLMERGILKSGTMPVIDEDDADDTDEPDDDNEAPEETLPEAEIPEDAISHDEFLVNSATTLVRAENKASISLIQRRLNIGYSKAAQVMDELEARGVVGSQIEGGAREVLPYDLPDDVNAD